MKQIFRSSLLALCAGGLCSVALAKLPAPTPEAAAKAAEAAAKAAWSGKVDNYKLCQAQDRVAAHYRKTAKDAKPAAVQPISSPVVVGDAATALADAQRKASEARRNAWKTPATSATA